MTAQLLLPRGLTPESVAILEEIALERSRSTTKYSAQHDDELTAAGWRLVIAGRIASATVPFGGEPDVAARQAMVEAAATVIAWIETYDRRPRP